MTGEAVETPRAFEGIILKAGGKNSARDKLQGHTPVKGGIRLPWHQPILSAVAGETVEYRLKDLVKR